MTKKLINNITNNTREMLFQCLCSTGGLNAYEEEPSKGPFGFGPALKLNGDKVGRPFSLLRTLRIVGLRA